MPKVLTNRRVQSITLACVAFVLTTGVASVGFTTFVGSSSSAANADVGSSVSSSLLASDGSVLADLHGEVDREPVTLAEIPKAMQNAAIAIEDRRFYHHRGIDPRGMARAFLVNVKAHGSAVQGGSTITEQLAKNLYFHAEPRTLSRKMAEMLLALGLEGLSSKHQILEAYLNTAYFGRGVYGVETAAHSYFGKDVSKLTLPESAFLAGLIHGPTSYDWTLSDSLSAQRARKQAALERRNVVLTQMANLGYISRSAAQRAERTSLEIRPPVTRQWMHPYFVDAVLRELGVLRNVGDTRPNPKFDFLGKTFGDRAQAAYRGGLRIYTTLDRSRQDEAERSLAAQLPPGVVPRLSAAVVSVQPGTGFVRTLIGGRDYYPNGCAPGSPDTQPACRHAQVNMALGSLAGGTGRQPGSSFKPVVLAAALEDGLSLKQTVNGSPYTYTYKGGTWNVQNYESNEGGDMSVVDAMVHSVNAAYARLEVEFLGNGNGLDGSRKVARMARNLGITLPTASQLQRVCGKRYKSNGSCTPADLVPAIALGAKEVSPLEMAAAYATFANEGVYAKPTTIAKITDAHGKVLYRATPITHRAMSRATALGVSYVLQQVIQRGTGTAAAIDRQAAGKTGTSQGWRDAWFDGYVPQLATSVWVGNPIVESMTPDNGYGFKVVGGTYPAQIWGAFMGRAVSGLPVRTFAAPPESLFGKIRDLHDSALIGQDGIAAEIALDQAGFRVIVHSQCPPTGGGDFNIWKQVQNGNTVEIWRSRGLC